MLNLNKLVNLNLIVQIAIGIFFAILLSIISVEWAQFASIFGQLFVQSLKAVAPILVFFLVISALANQSNYSESKMRPVITLYIVGTLCAAFLAVVMSKLFPISLQLDTANFTMEAPKGIGEVLNNLLFKLVDNPISAMMNSNFIGILVWGAAVGIGIRNSSETTKLLNPIPMT